MSAKDLTEALRKIVDESRGVPPERLKDRGIAPAVKSSALISGGGFAGGTAIFTTAGTNTIITSDGLFSIYFPETLETDYGGDTLTLGVIKKVTP